MIAEYVIAAVNEAIERNPGIDIIYVHDTPHGGAHAAIVLVGTPAYEAIQQAYPDREIPPHSHIEPGMF